MRPGTQPARRSGTQPARRSGTQPAGAEELLSWLATDKGRSANTVAAYRRDLAAYGAFLVERALTPAQVTESVVSDYVDILRAKGRAPASVARALVSVRALHRFLESGGLVTGNPAGHVGPPRVPATAPPVLSVREASSLLAAVVGDDAVVRRDRAMLEVLYACGLRVSELVGLGLGDVDLETGSLVVATPRGTTRVVPVGVPAVRALAAWVSPRGRGALIPARWARAGDADALLLNTRGGRLSRQAAWRIVHHYGEKVGLTAKLTPNVLRHSCAAHMVDHGADVHAVQELLGHASVPPGSAGTPGSTDRLRRVYDAAHPRARGEKPR